MSNFVRVWSDDILVRGYITGAELRDLDENTYHAIDGDNGGVWNPTSKIIVNGEGVVFASPKSSIDGASVDVTATSSFPFVFGRGTEDDYFGFSEDTTHPQPKILTMLRRALTPDYHEITNYAVSPSTAFGIRPFALGARFAHVLKVYNGAPSLDTVDLNFTVHALHVSLPSEIPMMRIIAVSNDGDEVIVLRVPDSDTDSDGFVKIANPVDPLSWFGVGVQTFTYTCNVAHKIDVSKYTYYAEFIAENGNNAQVNAVTFGSCLCSFSGVTIFDGRN